MNSFSSASTATSSLSAYVDFSKLRLGDRMASAWYAQQRRLRTGERFGMVDEHLLIPEPFPMDVFFPETFVAISREEIAATALPEWDQTILWINATNEFARHPANGFFEHIPQDVMVAAQELVKQRKPNRPRVLMHVLDDATYNHRRNWQRSDAQATARALQGAGCEVVILNPAQGQFNGSYRDMMAQMLAADAFIGGDTGPSHLFAQLCPLKPQLAIYPNMARDQRTYRPVQQSLGLPLAWNSLPLKANLATIQLKQVRKLTLEGWRVRRRRYQHFFAADVLAVLMPLLKAHRAFPLSDIRSTAPISTASTMT